MHGLSSKDPGRTIDWGQTSRDYAIFRPGPPPSFFHRLQAMGIGLPRQNILDLGTGTGALAREFAKQESVVSAVDVSKEQIEAAKDLARKDGLSVDFQTAPAEVLPFADGVFDIVTAHQCWLYFDKPKTLAEVARVTKYHGLLVTSHFSWLPREDKIAKASEELILKYNPQWTAADWSGVIPPIPQWAVEAKLTLKGMFYYDEPIPFTREAWRGRIRACRAIGATLSPSEVKAFDHEHEALLESLAGPTFTISHRLDAHIFEL